jgi:hypothetical protein
VRVERSEVSPLVAQLQEALIPRGYRAAWSEAYEESSRTKSNEIAIFQSTDQYAIIRARQANGGNYGISMDDIVAKLKSWELRCRFEIVGASWDWVAIGFETLPENLGEFAEEVYELCSDTVNQGVGLQTEQSVPENFAEARRLFPEISARMQKKLDEERITSERRMKEQKMPPGFFEMYESLKDKSTPVEMGIRLLALDIKKSKQLFMWWD